MDILTRNSPNPLARGTLLAAVVLLLAGPPAQAQMGVTEGGQASYSVPVAVPPGIAGMVPKLGLQYTAGSTGPMGHGWSLTGLSVLARCGSTIATDGLRRGVKYTADDRLCLDGQRLILTDASGVPVAGQAGYGLPGTEYRTERDSQSRIRAYGGDASTGPQYFRVWTKGGQVFDYGATPDSRILAQGKTAVMAWPVSRITDAAGNFMTVAYSTWATAFAGTTGTEWAVQQIRYTGNQAQAPAQRVEFSYEDRPDKTEAYHEGSKTVSTRRLAAIRTYVSTDASGTGGVKVNALKLGYTTSASTGRSLLAWTQLCVGVAESSCMPKRQFSYSQATAGISYAQAAPGGLTNVQFRNVDGLYGALVGDFNGDGRQDVLRWAHNTSENALYLSNGDGSFSQVAGFALAAAQLGSRYGCHYTLVADFNGDGISDLLSVSDPANPYPRACENTPGAKLFLGSISGSFQPAIPVPLLLTRTVQTYNYQCLGQLIDGNCTGQELQTLLRSGRNFHLADVNGDGLPDIVVTNGPVAPDNPPSACAERTCIYLGSQTSPGTFTKISTNIANEDLFVQPNERGDESPGGYKAGRVFVGDLNGDGLPDLLNRELAVRYMATGPAGQYSRQQALAVACKTGIEILDANGDGKWDTACLDYDLSEPFQLYINDGTGAYNLRGAMADWRGYQTPICLTASCPPRPAKLSDHVLYVAADLDGDGISDVLAAGQMTKANGEQFNKVIKGRRDGSFEPVSTVLDALPLAWNGEYSFVMGDFSGSGVVDILRVGNNVAHNTLFRRQALMPADLLVQVTEPTGAVSTAQYRPMSDPQVYARGHGAQFPVVDLAGGHWLVQRVDTANGLGGVNTTQISYGQLRAHVQGRGLLGFRTVQRQSEAPNGESVTTRSTYRQDYPYTGMPEETRRWRTSEGEGNWLTWITSSYADLQDLGCPVAGTPRVWRPVTRTSTERNRDLNMAALATVHTSHDSYNCHADPLQVSITTSGPVDGQSRTYAKVTTNTYLPANTTGDNWILGRLSRASVQDTVPDHMLASNSGSAPLVFDGLTLGLSVTSISQSRSSPGTITATVTPLASGGYPTYTFVWSRVTGSRFSFTQASNGALTVRASLGWSENITERFRATVTDQSGASRSQEIPVTFSVGAPPPLGLTTSQTSLLLSRNNPGALNGSVTATPSGGTGSYTYAWTRLSGNRATLSNTSAATLNLSANLAWGEDFTEILRITVTDNLGNTQSRDVSVRFTTPQALTATVTPQHFSASSICGNVQTIVLQGTTQGGVGAHTVSWTGQPAAIPITFTPALGDPKKVYVTWSPNLTTGWYRFTVTDAAGNTATFEGTITVNDICNAGGS